MALMKMMSTITLVLLLPTVCSAGRLRQQQSIGDSGVHKKKSKARSNLTRWQSDLGEMEKQEARMKRDLEPLRAADRSFRMREEARQTAKHVTDAPTLEPITTAEPTEITTAEPMTTAKPIDVTTAEPIEVTTAKPALIATKVHDAAKHVTEAPPTLEPLTTAEPTEMTTAKPVEVTTAEPIEVTTAKPAMIVLQAHGVTKQVTDAPTTLEPLTTVEPAEMTTAEPMTTAKPVEVTTVEPIEVTTAKPALIATKVAA